MLNLKKWHLNFSFNKTIDFHEKDEHECFKVDEL